jgi:hypothetical protein
MTIIATNVTTESTRADFDQRDHWLCCQSEAGQPTLTLCGEAAVWDGTSSDASKVECRTCLENCRRDICPLTLDHRCSAPFGTEDMKWPKL